METLTNYKDQSPSSEADSHFSGQNTGLVSLLKNQNVNYPVSIIVSYSELDGSVHTFILFTLRPILILPSSLCLETKVILLFLFSGSESVYSSHFLSKISYKVFSVSNDSKSR